MSTLHKHSCALSQKYSCPLSTHVERLIVAMQESISRLVVLGTTEKSITASHFFSGTEKATCSTIYISSTMMITTSCSFHDDIRLQLSRMYGSTLNYLQSAQSRYATNEVPLNVFFQCNNSCIFLLRTKGSQLHHDQFD